MRLHATCIFKKSQGNTQGILISLDAKLLPLFIFFTFFIFVFFSSAWKAKPFWLIPLKFPIEF